MTEFSDAPGKPHSGRRIAFPESEEQLRLLIETLQDYAIFTLDTQGRVSSWNIGAERIQGYGDHEIIGKHRIGMEEGNIILEVKDEGKGAPPGVLEFSSDALGTLGVGLRGMNERVRQLGGRLNLSSSEKGMTVRAVIPIAGSSAAPQRPE